MNATLAVVQHRPETAPTVLGRGPARIPVGGVIRAGIKVLTKVAAANPRVIALYNEGVEQGKSFDDIEKTIKAEFPDLRPLTPRNMPYFTVRPGDFPNPEMVRHILSQYGEDRGDGVKRLYRFPVVFPADQWQTVMPHELVAWGANERKFWSEYSADGRTRYCKCHAPVPMNGSGTRAIRVFGGRKTVLRQENDGICDPEHCPEYQERQCNLSGRFLFFMPGIPSLDAIQLPTNSFYSMQGAIDKFEMVGFMRGGRISGFLDGRNTPFYLTKELREIPHIDAHGNAVRVKQWLITLEAPVDVTHVLRLNEPEDLGLLPAAEAAVEVLEGRATDMETAGDATWSAAEPDRASGTQPEAGMPPAAGEPARQTAPLAVTGETELAAVIEALAAMGVTLEAFAPYADRKYGAGWRRNAGGRARVLAEIHAFNGDARALRAKIPGESCFS